MSTNSKKQKTILVTGGAGFIGSNLCARLQKDGHRVISLDNYFTGSEENHIEGVTYIKGHTRDISKLITESPDILYHLGEYSRVAQSMEEPDVVWDLNILGTCAVMEFLRKHPDCKLVYAGSSTKFAGTRADGIEGKDLSPYTWAKATNTDLVRNYGEWYGLKYATVYFYNVYGPRERAGKYGTVIEIFKQKMLAGEPLEVRMPGTQRRTYTHVSDTVDGLILAAEKGTGDGYGVSSSKSFTILEVAKLFGGEIVMLPERKTSRPSSLVDTAAMESIGWKETQSLEEYVDDFLTQIKK